MEQSSDFPSATAATLKDIGKNWLVHQITEKPQQSANTLHVLSMIWTMYMFYESML